MSQRNRPVTRPALTEAIRAMRAQRTPETQERFLEELEKSSFLLPAEVSPPPSGADEEGNVTLSESATLSFHTIENQAGQRYFLAFTCWEELGKWSKGASGNAVVLSYSEYVRLVEDNKTVSGFAIDPYGVNQPISRSLLRAWKERGARPRAQVVQRESSVQLGQPAVYPAALTGAVGAFLEGRPEVHAAYLQGMVREGEESYLIILDFDGDKRALFDGVAEAAQGHLDGMYLDLVSIDTEFGWAAVRNIAPFYQREL